MDINGDEITVNTSGFIGSAALERGWQSSLKGVALDNSTIVVAYEKNDTQDAIRYIAGALNGTSITWGTPVDGEDDISNVGITRLTNSKFAVAYEYNDGANGAEGRVIAGTVSGTTIALGAAQTFESSSAVGTLGITSLSESEVVIAYEDDGSTSPADPGKIIYGTISGTTFSFPGSSTSFYDSGDGIDDLSLDVLSNTEIILMVDGGSSDNSVVYSGLLSGNNISLSSEIVFLSGGQADDPSVSALTSDLAVLNYTDDNGISGIADKGESRVITFTSTTNPEINIQGNFTNIESGDNSPSTDDYTDFGTGASLSRTFVIQNQGAGTLTLGSNAVTITGADAANFSVDTQPATTVSGSLSTSFIINFTSSSATTHSAEIHINSDDIHEPDYFFAITAVGATAVAPTVSTTSASSIATTSATLGGNVEHNGNAAVTERGVVYSSTDSEPEIGNVGVTKDANGSGMGSFLESIGSLSSGTTYYVQAYAINSVGTSYGGVEIFTTLVPEPSTISASTISESRIDLTWDGTSSQFRVLQKPDSSSADETDGTTIYEGTDKSFSVTGLDTNATYFFTVFGMNATGTVFSSGSQKAVASTLPAEDSTQTNAQVGFLAGKTDSTYSYDSLGVEIIITTGSSSDGFLELFRFNASPQLGNLPGSAESEQGSITPSVIYDVHFWQVINNGLTGIGYDIALSLDDVPGIGQPTRLCVFKRSSSGDDWSDAAAGGATISYDAGLNALVISGLSTFSEFAIGSDGGDNPLPVELSGFSGTSTSNGIELRWITQSETNNAGFVVLRNGFEVASYKSSKVLEGQGSTTSKKIYTYIDADVNLDETHTYELVSVDYSGTRHTYSKTVEVTVTEALETQKVYEYVLSQNYPNPFNPSTTINFTMKQAGIATFKVYDMLGRMVSQKRIEARLGTNNITFNASGLSSGVYFYQLSAQGFSKTLKMMLVR